MGVVRKFIVHSHYVAIVKKQIRHARDRSIELSCLVAIIIIAIRKNVSISKKVIY